MGALPLITLFAALGNFTIGFWVLLHRTKNSATKIAFIAFSFITGLWSFSNFFLAVTPSFLVLSISYAFGTLVAASAVLWVLLFSRKKVTPAVLLVIGIVTVIFVVISFIPKGLVTEMVVENGYVFFRKDNFFFPLWSLYIVFTVFTVWWSLWSSMRTAKGIFREQIKFIFLGAIGFGGGALLTDVVFPYAGLNFLTILDGTVSLLFTFPAAYAMIRYRFMDVRLVIRKGAAYATTLAIAIGFYAYLVFVISQTTSNILKINNNITSIFIIILIAIGFHPLRRMVEYTLNEYFFPKRADLSAAAQSLNERLTSTVATIEEMLRTVRDEMKSNLNIEQIDLFIHKAPTLWEAVLPISNQTIDIQKGAELISYLSRNSQVLIAEEMEFRTQEVIDENQKIKFSGIKQFCDQSGIAVIIPLFNGDDLFAFLALGPKINKDAYSIGDIKFLEEVQRNF
ncbi:MAG: hypothetical protein ACD_11C00060G0003, partial [uncultured bacterium]